MCHVATLSCCSPFIRRGKAAARPKVMRSITRHFMFVPKCKREIKWDVHNTCTRNLHLWQWGCEYVFRVKFMFRLPFCVRAMTTSTVWLSTRKCKKIFPGGAGISGRQKFCSASKITILLEILAKFEWVLVCTCSHFNKCSHVWSVCKCSLLAKKNAVFVSCWEDHSKPLTVDVNGRLPDLYVQTNGLFFL